MQQITSLGAFTYDIASQINQNFQSAGLFTPGNIVYLDPFLGFDGNNGQTPTSAVQSLAQGYGLLREGKNDILVLMSNGLTTATARLTASFTWSKDAAHLMGVCSPSMFSQRARIAPTTSVAAFTPFMTISGSGCLFQNISIFDGFTTGTTAQIGVVVSGARNAFVNCHIAGMGDTASAQDAGSRTLVIQADENYFQHCTLGVDTITRTALNATVEFKSGAARTVFENCIFPCLASTGASGLAVICAAAGAIDRITNFRNCIFYNAAAFSGGAAGTGVMKLLAAAGGALLIDSNCVEYGYTDWGYDAASKLQILVSGPVPTSNSSGIAVVNT